MLMMLVMLMMLMYPACLQGAKVSVPAYRNEALEQELEANTELSLDHFEASNPQIFCFFHVFFPCFFPWFSCFFFELGILGGKGKA